VTTPVSDNPWENYQPAYPGVLTSVSDPENALFIREEPPSETNPVEDEDLDTDGLTDNEYAAIFQTPAALVNEALIATGWQLPVETTGPVATAAQEELQSRMPDDLKDYWLRGEGAARIRWGTKGSFGRCVSQLREHFPSGTEGLCANLYHEATGHWPGEDRGKK
jgi:hypothetical protein